MNTKIKDVAWVVTEEWTFTCLHLIQVDLKYLIYVELGHLIEIVLRNLIQVNKINTNPDRFNEENLIVYRWIKNEFTIYPYPNEFIKYLSQVN